MDKCDVCGKDTEVRGGWHLKTKNKKPLYLNFCSYECVAKYIEDTMTGLLIELGNQEKRIDKLEEKNDNISGLLIRLGNQEKRIDKLERHRGNPK